MSLVNIGPLLLLGALAVAAAIALAFYRKWWLGLIALVPMLAVIAVGVALVVRERRNDPITFSTPEYRLTWDRQGEESANWRLDRRFEGDQAHFTLYCPVDYVGVAPEFNVRIIDRTSFPVVKESNLNFYLLLQWQDQKVTLERGATKPVMSAGPLSGHLEWGYEMAEEAPNVFVLRVHLNYSPDERKELVFSKTVTVTVQVEQD